jgi:hypothetical protein
LGIEQPPADYSQDYGQSDVRVTVIRNQIGKNQRNAADIILIRNAEIKHMK